MKIAIIGAGITGLSTAKSLLEKGFQVKVFEKARGVGGRMSTRRPDDFAFDHGAQYFTARTKPFQDFVRTYEKLGVIKEWKGKVVSIEEGKKLEKRIWFEPHWVASPSMNFLCKELAKDLDVSIQTEIKDIVRVSDKWQITSKDGEDLGECDWVVSTAPPAQTYNLMPECFEHREKISQIEMSACFALMLGFKRKVETNWVAAKLKSHSLEWATINSTRPDRNDEVTSIQVHSSHSWSDENKDEEIGGVQSQMIEEFNTLTGIDGKQADYVSTHRWLYSSAKTSNEDECYVDFSNNLAACGDWCTSSRIEDAWVSGQATVNKIIESK